MPARVKSTFRLINGANQHNFNFEAELLPGGHVRVTVEAEGIGHASSEVVLNKRDERPIRFAVAANHTEYVATGNLRWDEPYHVIRFEGDLILANVAQVHMADCPVLELPV